MDVKQNFEQLTDEAREYIDLRLDSAKLYMVEILSSSLSALLSHMAIFTLMFLSLSFLLLALMFFLARFIGLVLSAIAVAVVLLLAALIVYLGRKHFFANAMLGRLCKTFFPDDNEKN